MRDNLKVFASGQISLYLITAGRKEHLLTRSNTILAGATFIVASVMGGDTSASLAKISAFAGATELAESTFTGKIISDIDNSVTYQALFNEASFDDTVTALRLGPADTGVLGFFAEATGLSIVKDGTQQLAVEWKIIFDN